MNPTEAIPSIYFNGERIAHLLCYPRPNIDTLRSRIKELESLGVKAIIPYGPEALDGMKILGKGCVSLVLLANTSLGQVALKIRRLDANRPDMCREAQLLMQANELGVGPKLIAQSANFLLMEFIDGLRPAEWLQSEESRCSFKPVFRSILGDCRKLDSVGLDHGEMSTAHKHLIIPLRGKPVILDFESASTTRHPSNVTSMCQYLFIGSEISQTTRRLLPFDKVYLIDKLRKYKMTLAQRDFVEILFALGLESVKT